MKFYATFMFSDKNIMHIQKVFNKVDSTESGFEILNQVKALLKMQIPAVSHGIFYDAF